MMANALQAVLDKAARGGEVAAAAPAPRRRRPAADGAAPEAKSAAAPAPAPARRRTGAEGKAPVTRSAAPVPPAAERAAEREAAGRRPVREGKRFVGAHVEPEVARQLKMLAAEDDTTIQDLLEEALDLLFAKKGKATLLRRRAG